MSTRPRNFVIRRAPEGQRDEIVKRWENVIAFQTDTEIKAFLRHYWISKHGDVKSQSLYREVKSTVEAKNINSASLSAELSDAAKLYRKLRGADVDSEDANELLAAIQSIGSGTAILFPTIMSNFQTLEGDEILSPLRALLNIYVRDSIIGGIENSVLENKFHKAARDLRASSNLAEFYAGIADGSLSDDDVRNRFQRLSLNQNGPRRYLLYCIERAKRGTGELSVNPPSKVHVEHIYPQTPAAGQKWANHARMIDRIGNLSLLDKRINSAIRNGGFAEKKPHYAKSEIILTQELCQFDDWNEERIAVRQEAMSALVSGIWPIITP